MADASVTLNDAWSIFNNIGGLHGVDKLHALAFFENNYGISAFNTYGAAIVIPASWGVTGLKARHFGDQIFAQNDLGLGISNQFGLVSLGVRVNYVSFKAEGLEAQDAFTIDFGGVAEITPELFFGASIFNLNQASMTEGETLPTVVNAGISYRPTDGLMLNAEVLKDINFDASFRGGVEYKIFEQLALRTGIKTKPLAGHYGLGFKSKNISVDYALSNHSQLGISHQASISYRL